MNKDWTKAAFCVAALLAAPSAGRADPVDDFRAGPEHPVHFAPNDPRRAIYAEALSAQTRKPGESDVQYRARLVEAARVLGITNQGESARVVALYLQHTAPATPTAVAAHPPKPTDFKNAQDAYARARRVNFGTPPSTSGVAVLGSGSGNRTPTTVALSHKPTFAAPPPTPVPARAAPPKQGWSDYFFGLARQYQQTAAAPHDDGSFRYWRTRTWNQLKGTGAALAGVALQPKTYTQRIPDTLEPGRPAAERAYAEFRRAPSWRTAKAYAVAYGVSAYQTMTYAGITDVVRKGVETDVERVGVAGKHFVAKPNVAAGLDVAVAGVMLAGDAAPVKGAVGGAVETGAKEATVIAAEEATEVAGESLAAATPRGPFGRLIDRVKGRNVVPPAQRATVDNVARDPKAFQALTGPTLARVDELARSGRLRLVDVKPGTESTLKDLPVQLVPGRYYIAVKTKDGIVLTDYELRHGGHRMLTIELGLPAPRKLDTPGTTVGGLIFYDDGVAVSGQALRYPSEENASDLARTLKGMGFRIIEKRAGPIHGPNSSIPSGFDARNMPLGI